MKLTLQRLNTPFISFWIWCVLYFALLSALINVSLVVFSSDWNPFIRYVGMDIFRLHSFHVRLLASEARYASRLHFWQCIYVRVCVCLVWIILNHVVLAHNYTWLKRQETMKKKTTHSQTQHTHTPTASIYRMPKTLVWVDSMRAQTRRTTPHENESRSFALPPKIPIIGSAYIGMFSSRQTAIFAYKCGVYDPIRVAILLHTSERIVFPVLIQTN